MSQKQLELKALTKRYGKERGIENITLSIGPGEIFGFLGPNGAGKTTTMSIVMGLLQATSGSVKLFGKSNADYAVENRRLIGYLAGDMALDAGLTGWQELEYFGSLRGVYDKEYIQQLAQRLQCDLTKKIKNLSRGNKQKVALIAALMHKPKLLILDEPTSGLDPLIQAEFNTIIAEHRRAGNAALISSHVLSEVQQICDKIAFIREGKLIAETTVDQIAKISPKQVAVTLKGKLAVDFTALKGVTNVKRMGSAIHFQFNGNQAHLLKFLTGQPLSDVTISDADLETIFMQYYEGENA